MKLDKWDWIFARALGFFMGAFVISLMWTVL